MKRIVAGCIAVLMTAALAGRLEAASSAVPSVLGFHSAIYDDGGNLIGDGEWNAQFRITDADGQVLYEERQAVTAVGGQVSALVGNGLDANGAPTGGVPQEALAPQGARYLEVEFEGMGMLPAMELAAVPYAGYAQMALGVSDEAIDGIAKSLTGGVGSSEIVLRSELDTLYGDAGAASTIGVSTSGFATSTSNDLQGLLADLDAAVQQNASSVGLLTSTLATETAERQGVDASLAVADGVEANVRTAADNALAAADVALDKRIDAVEGTARLSFMHSAWGTVTGGGTPTLTGANASVTSLGSATYRIALSPPMSNASYAAVVTPSDNTKSGSPGSPGTVRIYNKSAGSFDVQFVGLGIESFDFIVLGM